MVATRTPHKIWDYCTPLSSLVCSHIALLMYQLRGQTPEAVMLGSTPNISHICEFAFYEWVFYNDPITEFPSAKETLGCYLGPTIPGQGSTMSYYVLPISGKPITWTSLYKLMPQEMESQNVQQQKDQFDVKVGTKLGQPLTTPDLTGPGLKCEIKTIDTSAATPLYELYEDDDENYEHQKDADEFDPDTYNGYVTSHVILPCGDCQELATILQPKRDSEGNLIGHLNTNPFLDTTVYEIQFSDSQVLEYSANLIAEHLYSKADEKECHQVLIEEIVNNKKDSTAVPKSGGNFLHKGKTHKQLTTHGWKLCIQWENGSTSWERLADLKEAYPILVAKYTSSSGILSEPTFVWWAPSISC